MRAVNKAFDSHFAQIVLVLLLLLVTPSHKNHVLATSCHKLLGKVPKLPPTYNFGRALNQGSGVNQLDGS